MTVTDLDRAEWKARPPARPYRTFPDSSYVGIEVHHTVYPAEWDAARHARAIQAMHLDDKGWTDVFYAFGLPHRSRMIVELRGWNHSQGTENTWDPDRGGPLPKGYLMPVVLFGNHETEPVSDHQIAAFHELRRRLLQRNPSATVIRRHRDRAATACPGAQTVAAWSRFANPPPQEDDMTNEQADRILNQLAVIDAKLDSAADHDARRTLQVTKLDQRIVDLDAQIRKLRVGSSDREGRILRRLRRLTGQT